jgi:hypothetical protein
MAIVKSTTSSKVVKSNITPKVSNTKIITYGGDLDTTRFRWHVTPTPATDGAQVIFTIPDGEQYVSGLLEVFLDGLKQTKNVDYTETSGSTFTMTVAPDSNEVLSINYIRSP